MAKKQITPCAGLNAHRAVAEVAIELAHEWFEVYAHENAFYKKMTADGRVTEKQAREFFVLKMAPKLLEDARQAMTDCLTRPDSEISPHLKEQIFEALCLDNDLRANRLVATSVAKVPSVLH